MDVDAERALLIKELQQVEDISLLHAIKAVLHYGLKSEGKISIERNNSGNYRAFETHSYRISYRYTEDEIRILSFRHVKQDPKEY